VRKDRLKHRLRPPGTMGGNGAAGPSEGANCSAKPRPPWLVSPGRGRR
jgi:hypothetical protein